MKPHVNRLHEYLEREPSFWFEIRKPKRRDGPYENRQDAIAAAFKVCPDAKEVCVGYGSDGPYLDLRWHRRD